MLSHRGRPVLENITSELDLLDDLEREIRKTLDEVTYAREHHGLPWARLKGKHVRAG